MCGCRCAECRNANRLFSQARTKAKIFGDWNGLVSSEKVGRHLLRLSAKGVGYKSVAASCDVSKTCLAEVLAGRKRFVRARTEKKVLAVTPDAIADRALIPARQTWQRIDRLLGEGFSKREIARRLGFKTLAIQFNKRRITALNANRVERLYNSVMY